VNKPCHFFPKNCQFFKTVVKITKDGERKKLTMIQDRNHAPGVYPTNEDFLNFIMYIFYKILSRFFFKIVKMNPTKMYLHINICKSNLD
jgi:hypothetical protein